MKILVLEMEDAGCGLDFVLRCVAAGHKVRYFLRREYNQNIGKGFKGIQIVNEWLTSATWADLVFVTGNDKYIDKLEVFRKRGVHVFAPSVASAKLEIDRGAGMKFFADHGIDVPEYKTFPTLDAAMAYQMKSPDRHVFKTLGDEIGRAHV